MRKISFKGLIITSIFMIYLLFSIIFFFIMNNYILEDTIKRFKTENHHNILFVKDLINEKKDEVSQNARTVVWDDIIFNAVANKIYIKSQRKDLDGKELKLRTKKANRISFLNILSSVGSKISKSRTMDEKSIQLFDRNLKVLGKTKKLSKKLMDKGEEKYLKDAIKSGQGYGAGIDGILVERSNRLFIKGIDRFYIPNQTYAMGLAVVTKELDRFFLEEIKRKINTEVLLIKDNYIDMSTLNINLDEIKKFNFHLSNGKNKNFQRINLDNKEMGFSFFPMKDYNGKIVAHIGVGFDYKEVNQIYKKNMKSFIIVEILFSLGLLIMLIITIRELFRPFNSIISDLIKIKEGEYDEKLSESNIMEMDLISENINLLSDSVKEREESLIDLNKNLEKEVNKRTEDLRNLLDNSDQGFLTVDSNLLIDGEFSRECMLIFQQDITYKKISNLLYKNDLEKREVFENTIKSVFEEKVEIKRKVFLSLLPEEEEVDHKYLKLKYKLVLINKVQKLMIILTDITDKIDLENKVENESNILKMIVKVFTNYSETKEVLSEFIEFYNKRIDQILKEKENGKEVIFEFYRQIHTFKGNFAQLYMNSTADNLHELENKISNFVKNKKEIEKSDFIDFISDINFREYIENDLELLKSYLGENFIFKEEFVRISNKRLKYLELRIREMIEDEKQVELLNELEKLRYKSFKDLLKLYPDYVERIAVDVDKLIKPLEIDGEEILVNSKYYMALSKSLIHIFRNILDHGIEDVETRTENNKEESGLIKCIVEMKNKEELIINISDDGYGLNLDLIKLKLVEREIYTEEEIRKMTEEELVETIFIETFSTKEVVSNLSGRGIGLSAVKNEVENLNGKIKVYTRKGLGTRFEIKIPYDEKYFY